MNNVRVEKVHERRFGETEEHYGLAVNDVGAHLLQQTIQHEIGHHVWTMLSDAQRAKVILALKSGNQSKFKAASRPVNQYLNAGTYDWDEEGKKFPVDRIYNEMFAESVRWKQSDKKQYEANVPVALRRIIDSIWSGKSQKSYVSFDIVNHECWY